MGRGQCFDELFGDGMVRPWILAGNQLAIDNHIGLEIDAPRGHLTARSLERVRHVEVHLRVKNVIFDPLFFGSRKNGRKDQLEYFKRLST